MSLQVTATTFDEAQKKLAQYVMENFRCNTSRVDDVTIVCDSSESKDIRAHITDRQKKMIQLRRLYVNENEIDRAHKNMVKFGKSTFYFNDVKHEFDHKKGGCLKTMELSPDEVTVNLRASVVPWNLQFDLVLIDNLLREMGITPKKITLKIGYMRSKVLHALYWYIRNGWTIEQICGYQFGRSCIATYGRAKKPTCKYKNYIRFAAHIDLLREKYHIGDLIEQLEDYMKSINNEKEVINV